MTTVNIWEQKIRAIKIAASAHSERAERLVGQCLGRGSYQIRYKDFTEFDCENKEEYIFYEAEHLIDELGLPFDVALASLVADDEKAMD